MHSRGGWSSFDDIGLVTANSGIRATDTMNLLPGHGIFSRYSPGPVPQNSQQPSAAVDASQFSRLSFSFGLYAPDASLEASNNLIGLDFSRGPTKCTMDKKKLDTFKKRLETRQQELRRTVTRTQADGRTADEDTAQDIADRAASSYNKEFLFSQSNNERQLLQMVEGALARIREGSFGECISCGREINPKRLEAVPWTRHCIECQEKLEQGILEETSR